LIVYSFLIILAISFTSIIDNLINSVTNLIYNLGYFGIFTAALIETLFPIIPSELIFPLAGYVVQSQSLGVEQAIMFGFMGSLGSTRGYYNLFFCIKSRKKNSLKDWQIYSNNRI